MIERERTLAAVVLPYFWIVLSTFSGGISAYCTTASLMRRFAWWGTNQSMSFQERPVFASASRVARFIARTALRNTFLPFICGYLTRRSAGPRPSYQT